MAITPFDDLDAAAVLTAKEIADRLRVDPRSVRRAIARGDLVASRACGLRVLASDAAAWWWGRLVEAVPVAPRAVHSPPAAAPGRRRRAAKRAGASPERLPLPPRTGRG